MPAAVMPNSTAGRAIALLRQRGRDNPIESLDFAAALGIDPGVLHPSLTRAVRAQLVEKTRRPGRKQVAWTLGPKAEPVRCTAVGTPAPSPGPGSGGGRGSGAIPTWRFWPPDFVPTLHRLFGLADDPDFLIREHALLERAARHVLDQKASRP